MTTHPRLPDPTPPAATSPDPGMAVGGSVAAQEAPNAPGLSGTKAPHWRLLCGDAQTRLAELPAASVHCIVTSPPYFALRDYGVAGQIGLEPTIDAYLARLVAVFEQVKRVLHPSGVLWVNIGDSYANDTKWGGSTGGKHGDDLHGQTSIGRGRRSTDLPPKSLIGMPWRLAFALQAAGWILRQEIIWEKGSCMPESVTDRCTRSHEQVFMFAKQPRYVYDALAIAEPTEHGYNGSTFTNGKTAAPRANVGQGERQEHPTRNARTVWRINAEPFSVRGLGNGYTPPWTGGDHYAAFPTALAARCILAGSSQRGVCPQCGAPWKRVIDRSGGTIGKSWHPHTNDLEAGQHQVQGSLGTAVDANGKPYTVTMLGWAATCTCNLPEDQCVPAVILDPFVGTGTTVFVALRHGRSAIGVDLSADYVALARARIIGDAPFNQLSEMREV